MGINKSTIYKTVRRFEETGTNKNCTKSGRPNTETSEERQMEVFPSFVKVPHLTVRKASEQLEINRISIFRNLKMIKFRPYIIHHHQELNDDDFDR